jgi:hypothetical protein
LTDYKAGDEYYQVDRSYDVITTAAGPLYSLATEEFVQAIPGIHDTVVIGANRFPLNIQSTVVIVVAEPGKVVKANAVLERLRELEQFDRDLPSFALCVAVAANSQAVPVGRLGSRYRSGRTTDWLKFKNPAAPAVKREEEEDWKQAEEEAPVSVSPSTPIERL